MLTLWSAACSHLPGFKILHRRSEVLIMKLSVTLLAGFLVVGTAIPATAQQLAIDSATVDLIESHLLRALDGLDRMNLSRAYNHITRAMSLLPDAPPVVVGWFKVVTPFSWSQSSGPMPVTVGAMIDDGTPQALYSGSVVMSMLAYGEIVTLYDQNMVPLTNNQTTRFQYGGWTGYVTLRTSTGLTQDIGLKATDPNSGIAGGGNPIHFSVP